MLLGGCSAASPPPCPPRASPTPQTVPIPSPPVAEVLKLAPYQSHGHRSIQVVVGGQPETFLFDTGGGVTFVAPRLAEAAGCEPFGQLVGYRMRGDRVNFARCDELALQIDGVKRPPSTVGVFDISPMLPPDWPELGGLVALSSFEGQRVKLDLAGQRVSVSAPAPEPSGTPLRIVRQASGYSIVVLVPAKTAKGPLWLELDSGSDAPLILSPAAAKMLGVDLEAPEVEHHPAEKGQPASWHVPSVTLELPDVGSITTPAKVMDIIYDGNLGVPLIERFIWDLDLAHHRVRVEPTPSGASR